jgi:7-cyano-7-deazaguanine synthase
VTEFHDENRASSVTEPFTVSSPAIVLLSGGLDSATVLAIARSRGYVCHCLSFDYGQRHRHELTAAAAIAAHLQAASHMTLTLDLRAIGGSALTADIPVPKDSGDQPNASDIPITYVPARNLIFLSLAAAYAETLHAADLFIGVNAVDYSGYPDCRPEFIRSFEQTVNLATKAGVEGARFQVHTPLVTLSKAEIIRQGHSLGVDYALTTSCYDPAPDGRACGHCDSCRLRRRGFEQAGVPDPTRYV